ncbi:hypothetical protein O181_023634 [Austropuccinia psidii MF-1]|uniref:Uncharacterized protein n=1 Tax=Austropuccinia psidii MF-1 TaxID=1389203 RepID=A0A9Q3CH31_9BASI|nr:hypothetical protein [Austropuccinia psidii MF-1]
MAALTSMMAPGVLFPSQYTSDSSISSLGRSCHQLTCGVLPLPTSVIGMDAQSDSSDDHYSTHNEYNLRHETASASWDTRANQSVAQDRKQQRKRSDVTNTATLISVGTAELLAYMGQLTNEDYKLFDGYLGLKQASIEDSNDEGPLGSVVLHTTIKNVHHSLGHKYKKGCSRALNQQTLETQDKSGDVAYLVDQAFKPKGIEADQAKS